MSELLKAIAKAQHKAMCSDYASLQNTPYGAVVDKVRIENRYCAHDKCTTAHTVTKNRNIYICNVCGKRKYARAMLQWLRLRSKEIHTKHTI